MSQSEQLTPSNQPKEVSMLDMLAACEQLTERMLQVLDTAAGAADVDLLNNLLVERGSVLARMQKPDLVLSQEEREQLAQVQRLDDQMRVRLQAHLDDAKERSANIGAVRRAQNGYNASFAYGSSFIDRKR